MAQYSPNCATIRALKIALVHGAIGANVAQVVVQGALELVSRCLQSPDLTNLAEDSARPVMARVGSRLAIRHAAMDFMAAAGVIASAGQFVEKDTQLHSTGPHIVIGSVVS